MFLQQVIKLTMSTKPALFKSNYSNLIIKRNKTYNKRIPKHILKKQFYNNFHLRTPISQIPASVYSEANLASKLKFSTKTYELSLDSEKQKFILMEWVNDFPNSSHLTYEQIGRLASQSNKIGTWLVEAKQKYSNFKDKPLWFDDVHSDKLNWSPELREKLNQAKTINNILSKKKNSISLEAKNKMAEANEEHENSLIKLFHENPELIIHTFTIQVLPLEIHFTSMEKSSPEEASKYLNEELLKFQKLTLQQFSDGILTSTDLINILKTKS
jgi:hypothetical protein